MRGVCAYNSEWSRIWTPLPCIPLPLKTPKSQGLGAAAAIERGDRSAIYEREPHCRSRVKVTDRAAQRKGTVPFITHGAPGTGSVPSTQTIRLTCSKNPSDTLHMFPQRSGARVQRRRCWRCVLSSLVTANAGVGVSHVTAASAARVRLRLHEPRSAEPTKPRAAVRSTRMDAEAASSAGRAAPFAANVRKVVRASVNGEAVTGDVCSARTSESG